MFVVGLTGGVGSGKSLVADLFAKRDTEIIDTDIIARELVEPNLPAYEAVVKHFGHDLLDSEKQLDRKRLREIVFNDLNEKQWLEDLLHPLIREEMVKQIERVKSSYCIVVIPLLTESGKHPMIDHVLLIVTPLEEQIQRTMKRDHLSREQVKAMINAQATPNHRHAIADDVIINDGEIHHLEMEVGRLDEKYRMRSRGN